MGIKSELHEAILKRGGKIPPYGGIAAAMDELNKLPGGSGGGGVGTFTVNVSLDMETGAMAADKTYEEILAALETRAFPLLWLDMGGMIAVYHFVGVLGEDLVFGCAYWTEAIGKNVMSVSITKDNSVLVYGGELA